jgi:chorismate mutase
LLPEIAIHGDDGNYGSSAMYDVMILQALSRRIHYGKFVAESKFRAQKEEYTKLIQNRDSDGIMELLTDRAVELKVIERVKLKASTFGQDLNSGDSLLRIEPDSVAQLYDDWVMPLTKDVEVEYLLKRLDE